MDNAEEEFVLTMKRMNSTVSDFQRHFMHLLHGPDLQREDEEWTPTQGPISHAAVISSKISEKIVARQHVRLQGGVMERLDAFDRRFTQIRVDSLRSSNNMARIQADQATQQSRIHSLSVAQAQMGSVLSEMRTDIATFEERVLQSIDSLTQLFRRRFPYPSADP
ncbi:hypothetical protein Dimus_020774 [Dionaea muscipula]